MNPQGFVQQLKTVQSKDICSVFGECYYLINKAISFMSKAGNRRLLNATSDKREEILNVVQVSSGLFGREAIIMHEALHLKKKDLAEIIERKNPSSVLILVSTKRLPLDTHIVQLACYSPYENEMPAWITYLFGEKQKKIEHPAAQMLAHLYGRDLDSLAMEVEKIFSYVGERMIVSESDVLFVTRKNREHPIFNLLQGWGIRPLSEYLNIILQLRDSGELPLFIFNMFVRECKKLLEYKVCEAQGLTESEILKKLKLAPYFGRAVVDQSNRFSLEQLEEMLLSLATFDYSIKSGKVAPWNAVEASLGFISRS